MFCIPINGTREGRKIAEVTGGDLFLGRAAMNRLRVNLHLWKQRLIAIS